MQEVLSKIRWFFTGLRLAVRRTPRFLWLAFSVMVSSMVDYWKDSQEVVHRIAYDYVDEVTSNEVTTDYDSYVFWVCFSVASFFYLVAWYINAWLTVQAIRILLQGIFGGQWNICY
jgi:hypothetical protein